MECRLVSMYSAFGPNISHKCKVRGFPIFLRATQAPGSYVSWLDPNLHFLRYVFFFFSIASSCVYNYHWDLSESFSPIITATKIWKMTSLTHTKFLLSCNHYPHCHHRVYHFCGESKKQCSTFFDCEFQLQLEIGFISFASANGLVVIAGTQREEASWGQSLGLVRRQLWSIRD